MAGTWFRLDVRRRWRSLIVLALLVALTTGTVLAAVAGARRGQTAYDRLWARSLPAHVTVLANQPGFDWAKVAALPEVSAAGLVIVYYGAEVSGAGAAGSTRRATAARSCRPTPSSASTVPTSSAITRPRPPTTATR